MALEAAHRTIVRREGEIIGKAGREKFWGRGWWGGWVWDGRLPGLILRSAIASRSVEVVGLPGPQMRGTGGTQSSGRTYICRDRGHPPLRQARKVKRGEVHVSVSRERTLFDRAV